MGFFFRKSIGFGPFRINFSKSGVSYSAGVKGARINIGNRGIHLNLGKDGLYYRTKISDNTGQATSDDATELNSPLLEKSNQTHYYRWFGIFPLIICSMILVYMFFSTTTQNISTTTSNFYITPLSAATINIRILPEKSATIIGTTSTTDQKYLLLEDNNEDWYKIKFNEQIGYIFKSFAKKISVSSTQLTVVSTNLFTKNPGLFWKYFSILIIAFLILRNYLKKIDRRI